MNHLGRLHVKSEPGKEAACVIGLILKPEFA